MTKVFYELCPKCGKTGLHEMNKRKNKSDNIPFTKKECKYCHYRVFIEILPTK